MPSGIYRCAITIWRHLKESLRPQFSFEKADIAYIHFRKACREFRCKINLTTAAAIGVLLAFTGKKMFYFN
jgi:hypothetical protein